MFMHLAGWMDNMSLSTGLVISSPLFASVLVMLLTPDNDNESAGFLLTVNTQQSVSWHLTAKKLFFWMCGWHTTSNMRICFGCAFVWVSLMVWSAIFLWFNNSNYDCLSVSGQLEQSLLCLCCPYLWATHRHIWGVACGASWGIKWVYVC